ncbi:xanthine dehydrogenase accessory protein XdhC [Acidovorax lacteus]|uniref:Xanthine dehydrogenase accessory protein XdhC n=1 Tax=Acidovorax lacteus TaxID=1924988 RepID=A0ABP8LJ40_9BURK
MSDWTDLQAALATGPVCLVGVESTQGSVPRERGAWMAVLPERSIGTIGGGHLEFEALAEARARLAGRTGPRTARYALGPSLGQCCGGVVHLAYDVVTAHDLPALAGRLGQGLSPLALFGGGHVGHALVRALVPLPYAVRWVDSRDGIFAPDLPGHVSTEVSEPVHEAVRDLPAGSEVLVMSFSHAEDLDIVAACLRRQRQQGDLPFVGLIGSRTKWATFSRRLAERGFAPEELAHITCPIGLPGITGKEPAVIAAAVVAQLLLRRSERMVQGGLSG